ncbi:MAG TPA: hypothetical protein VEG68_16485 [Terriglobales bacterium]|nr:hypothetical protein [Terriglobales bacterium]
MGDFRIRSRLLIFPVLSLILSAQAQQNVAPAVAFNCDFPGSDPAHYGILVSTDGHASYISDGKLTPDSDPSEPFTIDFTMPQATLARIFDLTRKAHYFEGEIDSKKKNIASTGEKTLMYKDGQKNTSATYNYSAVPAVQELTTLFQNLSIILEYGRRLEYDHRYQKLALDEELKQMDEGSTRGELGDVAVIAPMLKKIIDDPSVVNAARARAQRLLDHAGAGSK